MQRMMCGTIDDLLQRVSSDHIGIMDKDGPEVDKDEQAEVDLLMEREEEGEDVVWQRLQVAIERVKRVGGKWGGNQPLVVRLMQPLVADGVMLPAVNPVDAIVCEGEEEEYCENEVSPAILVDVLVKFRVTSRFSKEPRKSHKGHSRERFQTGNDLLLDLVLEEPGMLHHIMIEDVFV